ncbi:hypothetical protein BJV82DRAFT_669810 [Fennellomyces sp. T-0311]|nr:hypothetical protein BJV82DRAFT_669810 [Fennellomyces sp. T-0311]
MQSPQMKQSKQFSTTTDEHILWGRAEFALSLFQSIEEDEFALKYSLYHANINCKRYTIALTTIVYGAFLMTTADMYRGHFVIKSCDAMDASWLK